MKQCKQWLTLALCRSVGLELTLDDFQDISDKVPFIADLKPSGKYVMEDLHKVPNSTLFKWIGC
jgi:dihydroxyacid dehydratase/phosphogluconate dehydratase